MATYTITRKHYGSIDNQLLHHLLVCFNNLYTARTTFAERTEIEIRGNWVQAFKGDGLWLGNSLAPGIIKEIGRKYVTIEFKNHMCQKETIKLELEPKDDDGWTEITFITMPRS